MLLVLVLLLAQAKADLAPRLKRAQEYFDAGRFREALPLCAELVKANPGNAHLLANLGIAEHMTGDHRAAEQSLRSALKLDSNLYAANLYLGLAEISLGRPATAIRPLEKALELQPTNAELRQLLAGAFYDAGMYDRACDEFRQLTWADPSSARAWYALGRTWSALAGVAYGQLLSLVTPDSAYALAVQADGLMRRQQFRRAFVIFREALGKDPDLVTARAALAGIYQSAGHPDWAAKEQQLVATLDCSTHAIECELTATHYEAVLERTQVERTPAALFWRAQAYTGLAYQAFAKLEQLPASVELHRFRAGVHYEAGRRAQVVEELRRALNLAPQDRGLRRDLAMALGAASDYPTAYQLALELLRDDPGSPELNALAGDALLNSQKPREALAFLKRSVAADPHNLVTRASLGRAYMQTGAVKLALPHLEAAIAADKDGSLHYQLARAYNETGQTELAREAMAKYQELSAKAARPAEPEITAPEF